MNYKIMKNTRWSTTMFGTHWGMKRNNLGNWEKCREFQSHADAKKWLAEMKSQEVTL